MINTIDQATNHYSFWNYADVNCTQPQIGNGMYGGGQCSSWSHNNQAEPSTLITSAITSPFTIEFNTGDSCEVINYIGAEADTCFQAPLLMITPPNAAPTSMQGWILSVKNDVVTISQYTSKINISGLLCGDDLLIQNVTMSLGHCQQPNPDWSLNLNVVLTDSARHTQHRRHHRTSKK